MTDPHPASVEPSQDGGEGEAPPRATEAAWRGTWREVIAAAQKRLVTVADVAGALWPVSEQTPWTGRDLRPMGLTLAFRASPQTWVSTVLAFLM